MLNILNDLDSLVAEAKSFRDASVSTSPSPHIHTNDFRLDRSIRQVIKHFSVNETRKPAVGMVVGSGALISIAPLIPVDIWLVIDRNTYVLDWVEKSVDAVRTADGIEQYKEIMYDDQQNVVLRMAPYLLNREMESIADYHFLHDDVAFKKSKEAFQTIAIVRCEGDLTNAEFTGHISKMLKKRGLEICIANMTNVHEVAFGMDRTLQEIPFSEKAPFLWSEAKGTVTLKSYVSYDVSSYMGITRPALPDLVYI